MYPKKEIPLQKIIKSLTKMKTPRTIKFELVMDLRDCSPSKYKTF